MRFYLFVLLMFVTSAVAGQSTFPLIAPATLASYLPTSVGEFDRWAISAHHDPYVAPDAKAVGGFYRTQVQTIQQTLPMQSGSCSITAAGIIYTRDKVTDQDSRETLLIEVTDYAACLHRIKQDIDHFSIREVNSGPHAFRQEYLESGIKVRVFRDLRPGGELKATFIINDRFQVFMKYQSQGMPPDSYFLTGAFRESSLYELADVPHVRGIASPVIPKETNTRHFQSLPIQLPVTIGPYTQTSAYTAFQDYYQGFEMEYENPEGQILVCTVYDFANRQEGWYQFEAASTMEASEYQHIGQLIPVSSRRMQGVILRPEHYFDQVESIMILDDRYVLRIYCQSWGNPGTLAAAFTEWEQW